MAILGTVLLITKVVCKEAVLIVAKHDTLYNLVKRSQILDLKYRVLMLGWD